MISPSAGQSCYSLFPCSRNVLIAHGNKPKIRNPLCGRDILNSDRLWDVNFDNYCPINFTTRTVRNFSTWQILEKWVDFFKRICTAWKRFRKCVVRAAQHAVIMSCVEMRLWQLLSDSWVTCSANPTFSVNNMRCICVKFLSQFNLLLFIHYFAQNFPSGKINSSTEDSWNFVPYPGAAGGM